MLGFDGAPSYGQAGLAEDGGGHGGQPWRPGRWVVARDGRTAPFGDAGRPGALNGAGSRPVVGMAVAPGGKGYWLATSDGHVLAFGDAGTVAPPPGSPRVVAIVAAPPGAAATSIAAATPSRLSLTGTSLPALSASQPYSAQFGGFRRDITLHLDRGERFPARLGHERGRHHQRDA